MDKPEHLEIITKEEILKILWEDLDTMLEMIRAEETHLVDEHPHNMGMACRLAEMWPAYAEKLQSFIRLRSTSEEQYCFVHDTKTGHVGFKHHRQPWGTIGSLDPEKPAPGGCKHGPHGEGQAPVASDPRSGSHGEHGPSATEAGYM